MTIGKRKPARCLFFETHSLSQIFFLFKEIKKANTIIFLANNIYVSWKGALGGGYHINRLMNKINFKSIPDQKRKIIQLLIHYINPEIEIKNLNLEDFAELYYTLNKECLQNADEVANKVRQFSAYDMILEIVNDRNTIKYFKAFMAAVIPRWVLFSRLAKNMIHADTEIVIIPDNVLNEFQNIIEYKKLKPFVPAYIFKINRLRFLIKIIMVKITLFFLPILLLAINLKNGFGKIVRYDYDLAVPVLHGFYGNRTNRKIHGVKRLIDDSYFYGEGLKPGQIVHIFGDWQFPGEVEALYKKNMKSMGIHYLEKRKYRLNTKSIIKIFQIQWVIFKRLFNCVPINRMNLALLYADRKAFYNYINKYIELENVNYKVEYVRTDYNPAHIINTILCNQNNRKTVGIAHAASPMDAPQLAFVHFDKYLSLCRIYDKIFSPYWDNVNLIPNGRETLDKIWIRLDRQADTINKIDKLYRKRNFIITITLPGGGDITLKSGFEELYKALCSLKSLDIDCLVFLRVRRLDLLQKNTKLAPFKKLPQIDSRIIMDHDNFDTLELISVSNCVIAAAASWIVNESAVAGKKVFTFAFTNKENLYFPNYGKDFILRKSEDVLKVFKGLENQFEDFDCDWEKLKKDADYYHDGNNCDRIRKTLIGTINNIDTIQTEDNPRVKTISTGR